MPLLTDYTYPQAPVEIGVEQVRAQLDSAVDTSSTPKKLNVSVKLGIDAVMSDAIQEKPLPDAMPCIRILFPVESYYTDASTGSMVWQIVPLQLYFLYYFGEPSQRTTLSSFTTLRDRHIRWNLEYLKDKRVKPNSTIGLDFPTDTWVWQPGQIVNVDHDTPFRYLDETIRINPSTGFTCSRVDITMKVRNHI